MGKWMQGRKNANKTTAKVPPLTVADLRAMGIRVRARIPEKIKYAWCHPGYDMLENLFVVRYYICDKYELSFRTLEMLLKLYAMNYFKQRDYYELPKNFQLVRIDYFLKRKLVTEFKKGRSKNDSIFKLSVKGKHCVEEFYECLSGERKIPEVKSKNKMADSSASKIDKLRLDFIKKMNQTEPSETKKRFYE